MQIVINKQLILENNREIEKIRLQNFIHNVSSKDQAAELHNMAALDSGVVDANMKNAMVKANFDNKVVHAGYADRDGNNKIDASDIKQHILAGKSF